MDMIHREFSEWISQKYGWTYGYFCRICGEARQEEIWNEFFRERETKNSICALFGDSGRC